VGTTPPGGFKPSERGKKRGGEVIQGHPKGNIFETVKGFLLMGKFGG